MRILIVASDPMEFPGILAHSQQHRRVPLAANWVCFVKLAGHDAMLAANGAGALRAAAAVDAATPAFHPEAIVSTGFCGALDERLDIADIVVATGILSGNQSYPAQPVATGVGAGQPSNPAQPVAGIVVATGVDAGRESNTAQAIPAPAAARSIAGHLGNTARPVAAPAATGLIATHPGLICSIDHVAQTAAEKRQLRALGACAVEMEAAGVAGRAQSLGLPFYCIRAVTDLAGETMANDFNRALRSDGHFGTISILQGTLRHPTVRLPELFRLRKRCARAARVLGEFFADCRF